jgi:protein SCO1/2
VQFIAALLFFYQFAESPCAEAQTLSDATLARIGFEQRLNAQVSLDLTFQDEQGRSVRLGEYFGKKPVILVLGYYGCPMLCTMVLNGLVEDLQDMKWSIGKEFEVVNVSINPRETATLAAAKKRTYLRRYSRSSAAAGWHFMTGEESASKQLSAETGFRYAFDPVSKEYAHPSGLIVLTPEGRIARYFFGVKFAPNELYEALQAASSHKIGSRIQELILLCFHYRPITGKYGALVMMTVRILGIATVVGLATGIITMVRREKVMRSAAGPGDANRISNSSRKI